MFQTPVALFVYNRPGNAERVLDTIRKIQPNRLLVIADGPRPTHPTDERQCELTRRVIQTIDWPCDVQSNVAPANLGMKRRFVSGLKWIFEQVEDAIILEDDCLPDPSFFRFCAELLEHYRHDPRVAMINGTRYPIASRSHACSYLFSAFGAHWGWATWRRAWLQYDPEMKAWADPELRRRLAATLPDEESRAYYSRLFNLVWNGSVDAWDCEWTLGQVLAGRLAIVPGRNLISNIGFSDAGSHTRTSLSSGANITRHSMPFPLAHPERVEADSHYDTRYLRWRVGRPDTESLLHASHELLQANRTAQALLLIEGFLRKEQSLTDNDRKSLLAARSRALGCLRTAQDSRLNAAASASSGHE